MSVFEDVGARLVRATLIVDRAQRTFDRARSALVARFASDRFLETYNDLAHRTSSVYVAGSQSFRSELFHWEEEMARRTFPPPPARLLVGGAGGGREVYAWAKAGYEVVAFEPSASLARLIAERRTEHPGTEAWKGRYEDLPMVRDLSNGMAVDLSTRGPFDVAVLGWVSYSHLRGRDRRVAALAQVARLTRGAVVLSFYFDRQRDTRNGGRLSAWSRRLGFSKAGDAFSPYLGFHHWSTEAEILDEVDSAGLEVTDASWDARDGHWPWIAARRRGPDVSR